MHLTIDDVPSGNLNRLVAEAWRAMPFDDADAVWDRLRHGVKWEVVEDDGKGNCELC